MVCVILCNFYFWWKFKFHEVNGKTIVLWYFHYFHSDEDIIWMKKRVCWLLILMQIRIPILTFTQSNTNIFPSGWSNQWWSRNKILLTARTRRTSQAPQRLPSSLPSSPDPHATSRSGPTPPSLCRSSKLKTCRPRQRKATRGRWRRCHHWKSRTRARPKAQPPPSQVVVHQARVWLLISSRVNSTKDHPSCLPHPSPLPTSPHQPQRLRKKRNLQVWICTVCLYWVL